MEEALITIRGAWAELTGVPIFVLDPVLKVMDPDAQYSRAFKEKRWDGLVLLYEGNRFPAGLTSLAAETLKQQGHHVRISGLAENPIDLSRFTSSYLPGITLRPHQMDACLAILTTPRLIVRSPTASGKTFMVAAPARYFWEERGWTSIVVVPKKGLCTQTVAVLRKCYGPDISVGQYGDGIKTIGTVTVCTGASLMGFRPREISRKVGNRKIKQIIPADPKLVKLVASAGVLFLDEAHHASSETWLAFSMACNAKRRIGLSGTPITGTVLRDMQMIGATGPVLCEVDVAPLMDSGLASRPRIAAVMSGNASGPELPVEIGVRLWRGREIQVRNRLPYPEAYVQGVVANSHHNQTVIRAAEWMVEQGRRVLMLCRRKDHFQALAKMLDHSGLRIRSAWGATPTPERELAKKAFASGRVDVLLASEIFSEGEDLPSIDAIVLAEGIKSNINSIQRIGRGMRPKEGGDGSVWVVDVVPTCHPRLMEHALQRVEAYEGEGYEVKIVTRWPKPGENELFDLLPFKTWNSKAVAV